MHEKSEWEKKTSKQRKPEVRELISVWRWCLETNFCIQNKKEKL